MARIDRDPETEALRQRLREERSADKAQRIVERLALGDKPTRRPSYEGAPHARRQVPTQVEPNPWQNVPIPRTLGPGDVYMPDGFLLGVTSRNAVPRDLLEGGSATHAAAVADVRDFRARVGLSEPDIQAAQRPRDRFRETHFGGRTAREIVDELHDFARSPHDDRVDADLQAARVLRDRALSVTKPKSLARRVLERLRPFLPPAWIGVAAGVCVAVALILLATSCASDGDDVVLGDTCSACASDVDCAKGLHCDRGTWTCRTPQQVGKVVCDVDCLLPLPTISLDGKASSMCEAYGRCRAFAGECRS